jgi:hypothetical protein
MGDGRNDFYIGTKANASKYHWFGATATHGHTLTTTFTGGVLKLHIKTSSSTNSPSNTELADLSAAVKDLSGDSSTGKLSWSTYGGDSGNFNIADTAFYKKAAVKSAKTEAGGTTTGSHILITFLDETTKTYDSNTLSLSGDSVV